VSRKADCPGCNSRTSDIAHAFDNSEPCPTCGLSAGAAAEILTVQEGRASDAVKARFEELRLRADRAEARAEKLWLQLAAVRNALDEEDES
jgi:hypothetical protein